MGDEYIKKYPSQSFDLSRQSASFVDFLEFHPILDEFPCLYDLANFEKKFQQIFHAPREESLKSDQLAQTQALEERQLVFKKHLELLASPYNIFPLWQQRTDPLKKLISNLETACYLVLHKKSEDGQVYVQSLSPGGFELLELLLKGLNLNLALEEIKSELSESDVAQLFQFLVADRLIVAV